VVIGIMNPALQSDSANVPAGPAPGFSGFILYDELAAGLEAHDLFEHAARLHDAGAGAPARCAVWRLDLLAEPGARESAARQAGAADMVIIALRRPRGEVARELDRWAADWLPRKRAQDDGALVVLLPRRSDEAGGPDARLDAQLSALADRAGMVFLVARLRSVASPRGLLSSGAEAAAPAARCRPLPSARSPVRGWGINE
jgi:hypothetical protein